MHDTREERPRQACDPLCVESRPHVDCDGCPEKHEPHEHCLGCDRVLNPDDWEEDPCPTDCAVRRNFEEMAAEDIAEDRRDAWVEEYR